MTRLLPATALLVSAAVHLVLWFDAMRDSAVVGPAFMLNAVGGSPGGRGEAAERLGPRRVSRCWWYTCRISVPCCLRHATSRGRRVEAAPVQCALAGRVLVWPLGP